MASPPRAVFAAALLAAALAILLAGCEASGGPEAAPEVGLDAPLADEPATPAEPAAEAPAESASETAALPPQPTIDDDPARLIGLTRARLDDLLGAPALVRREPPAEIRQYRAEDCVFDIFLYEDQGEHRVTYVEARDDRAGKVEPRPCLNRLLRAHLGLPLG